MFTKLKKSYILVTLLLFNLSLYANVNMAVEIARLKKIDQAIKRVNSVNEYANLYIIQTGAKSISKDKIKKYFLLDDYIFKSYNLSDDFNLTLNKNKIKYTNVLPNPNLLTPKQRYYFLHSPAHHALAEVNATDYSISILLDPKAIKILNSNINFSLTPPKNTNEPWYKPDGKGGYEKYIYKDGKWELEGKEEGNKVYQTTNIVQSKDELKSKKGEVGDIIYVKNKNNTLDKYINTDGKNGWLKVAGDNTSSSACDEKNIGVLRYSLEKDCMQRCKKDGWECIKDKITDTIEVKKVLTKEPTILTKYKTSALLSKQEVKTAPLAIRDVIQTTNKLTKYSCPSGYSLSGTKCVKRDYKNKIISTRSPSKSKQYRLPSAPSFERGWGGYIGVNGHWRYWIRTNKTLTWCAGGTWRMSDSNCPRGYRLLRGSTRVTCPGYYAKDGRTKSYTSSAATCVGYRYSCPRGYRYSGGTCKKSVCPSGYTSSGSRCVRTISINATKSYYCPSGYSLKNNTCQKTVSKKACPAGYSQEGNNCKKVSTIYYCPSGYEKYGNVCRQKYIQKICPADYKLQNNVCQKTITTKECPKDYILTDGKCILKDQ